MSRKIFWLLFALLYTQLVGYYLWTSIVTPFLNGLSFVPRTDGPYFQPEGYLWVALMALGIYSVWAIVVKVWGGTDGNLITYKILLLPGLVFGLASVGFWFFLIVLWATVTNTPVILG